jgi:soluble lytic murein transglycosylase-like protein
MILTKFTPVRLLALATTLLSASAHGQTLDQYLALRKHYGIVAAARVSALDTLVGTRVVEIEGIVKGTVLVKGEQLLLLERLDGSDYLIHSNSIPTWLNGNETKARLIVSATRTDPSAELSATLLGVVPSSQVAEAEQTAERKHAKASLRPPTSLQGRKNWTLPSSQVTPIYANFVRRQNPRLSKAEAMHIAKALIGFSIEYGVDARLIIAMVIAESGFDPNSTSSTGAMGLGQLMPGTAKWMGVTNAYDTTDNLYGTVKLIRTHLNQYRRQTGDEFESIRLSLAAYNAGAGAVSRAGGVPQYRETQNYVKKVIRLYYGLCGVRMQ